MSFTLWFMGRPAAGKSTIASAVERSLLERGINSENLDGDDLRANLDPELGFSKEDRHVHNRRTAYLAKVLNRNDIPVIVAMITPFRESQQQAREIVETDGEFVLVYVKCPLETAEARDPKGHYEQARAGEIEKFTGISHPFNPPTDPDIEINTAETDVASGVERVLAHLVQRGILDAEDSDGTTAVDPLRRADAEETLRDKGYKD